MLARALWDAKQDPARAVRLAAEARQEAASLPDEESSVPELRHAMDRWIAKLPPAARRDLKAAMATPKPADPARDALSGKRLVRRTAKALERARTGHVIRRVE